MRKTFDPDAPPLPPHGSMPKDDRLPCRKCRGLTSPHVLSGNGAMCAACYEVWKREPIAGRYWDGPREKPTLAELVSRLEIRQAEGERLGEAQLDWLAQAKRKLGVEA